MSKSTPKRRNDNRRRRPPPPANGALWLYGRHAVAAAIANSDRKVRGVYATMNAAQWLIDHGVDPKTPVFDAKPEKIDALLPDGAVHQGIAADVEDLPRARLKDVCTPDGPRDCVVVLDQLTDPQNIGAIFRSAAAFGARAIIVQERRTPPLSGALAKAAAGAIERVPCVKVVNIARALEALQNLGYHCAGLAGGGKEALQAIPGDQPCALVMGAEGAGLRDLVSKTCDGLYRISISANVESLNVSTAAAVSLYEITQRRA